MPRRNSFSVNWSSLFAEVLAEPEGMYSFECTMSTQGFSRVAGLDEAGRGPMAGPIVAAAVVLAHPVDGLNDSKLLTEERREELYAVLRSGTHGIGVCIIESHEIDRMGIQQANYLAMARAAQAVAPEPDCLLVDGFKLPGVRQHALQIIKGDQRSASIAAASIIAKVTRDRIMVELHEQWPEYGFDRHKGYCTREHSDTLGRFGPCPIHRRSFAPVADAACLERML